MVELSAGGLSLSKVCHAGVALEAMFKSNLFFSVASCR